MRCSKLGVLFFAAPGNGSLPRSLQALPERRLNGNLPGAAQKPPENISDASTTIVAQRTRQCTQLTYTATPSPQLEECTIQGAHLKKDPDVKFQAVLDRN